MFFLLLNGLLTFRFLLRNTFCPFDPSSDTATGPRTPHSIPSPFQCRYRRRYIFSPSISLRESFSLPLEEALSISSSLSSRLYIIHLNSLDQFMLLLTYLTNKTIVNLMINYFLPLSKFCSFMKWVESCP